jgi:hypothetical protein
LRHVPSEGLGCTEREGGDETAVGDAGVDVDVGGGEGVRLASVLEPCAKGEAVLLGGDAAVEGEQ